MAKSRRREAVIRNLSVPNKATFGGTQLTATAAELNTLDGILADVNELNILNGVTANAVEINSACDATNLGFDGILRLVALRATYDFAVNGGAISAISLGRTVPDNGIILGGFIEVATTLTSATDAATVAVSVQGANDIVSAIAISNGAHPWDAGLKAIIPKFNTPETTSVKTTADRLVTATIATEALTAGKFTVWLFYVIGN